MKTASKNKQTHLKEFSDRLNLALDHLGIPPLNHGRTKTVAEMFLVSQAGAGKWINGVALPSAKKREELSQRLGVNTKWLESGHGEMFRSSKLSISPLREIPILTISEAENYEKILSNFIGQKTFVDIELGKNGFVIISQSDAMAPRFPKGSFLVFDPDCEIRDGDYVLVKTKSFSVPLFRQFINSSAGSFLLPIDPKFKVHTMTSNDVFIAKMVQHRMDY